MGSCLSCKSGGGARNYNTITMDSTEKTEENFGLKRSSPYTRNNHSTFGFKRRLPTALKSLSQERTSELVQNYETKIANINTNSPSAQISAKTGNNLTNKLNTNNRILHSNIPRYSSKGLANPKLGNNLENASSSHSSLNSDPNCNTLIDAMTPEIITNSLIIENRGSKPKLNSASNRSSQSKQCITKNYECTSAKNHNGHKNEMCEATGNKARLDKGNFVRDFKSTTKIPKTANQTSGLPRLVQNASAKGYSNSKDQIAKHNVSPADSNMCHAPLAKFDEVEIMHISSDTLTEEEVSGPEIDSGVGNSISEKVVHNDGDSETLAEVNELAKDVLIENCETRNNSEIKIVSSLQNGSAAMTKSREIPSVSLNATQTISNKIQADVSVERPKGLPVPKRFNTFFKSTPSKIAGVEKSKVKSNKNQESTYNSSPRDKASKVKAAEPKAKCFNGSAKRDVNTAISPDSYESQQNLNSALTKPEDKHKSKDKTEDSSWDLSPMKNDLDSVNSLCFKGNTDGMVSSVESSASQAESFPDTGPFSPPSERDTFLIDDEIADQPELIACQSHELQRILHSSQDTYCLEQDLYLGDISDMPPRLYGAVSAETLSSASSINSDDLMLDFDPTEDAVGDFNQTSRSNRPKISRYRTSSTSEAQGGASNSLSDSSRNFKHPKQMTATEIEDGEIMCNSSSDQSVIQDVTVIKSMLLKLQQTLAEADTLNPFDSLTLKNGLFHNLAHNDTPDGCITVDRRDSSGQAPDIKNIVQENFDLRRQLVFLQQQLEEKNQSIRLLQQQMTKFATHQIPSPEKEVCNAATQTEKPRLSSTVVSQSYEETACGTTVSSNGSGHLVEEKLMESDKGTRPSSQPFSQITRSLSSLTSDTNCVSRCNTNSKSSIISERSASAVELCRKSNSNLIPQPSLAKISLAKSHSKLKPNESVKATKSKNAPDSIRQPGHLRIAGSASSKGLLPQQPRMGMGIKTTKSIVPPVRCLSKSAEN